MPIDLPSVPPTATQSAAAACHVLTSEEAARAFQHLRRRLPSTEFEGAAPSEICGLVRVQLKHGTKAYTDVTGRYFLLALSLDTNKGSPADGSTAIDAAVRFRSQTTSQMDRASPPL